MSTLRVVTIAVQIFAALLCAGGARAACLVLAGGAGMEVSSVPETRGGLVVFHDRNGRLTSLRATEVDSAATVEANRLGRCAGPAPSRSSPLRETSRPVAIAGPSGVGVHSPTAAEILAAMPAAAAGRTGPPRGYAIDCRVVECGKRQSEPPAAAPRPAVERREAEESTPVPSPAAPASPAVGTSRKLFGEGFRPSEPAADPQPAPRTVVRRKPPHRG